MEDWLSMDAWITVDGQALLAVKEMEFSTGRQSRLPPLAEVAIYNELGKGHSNDRADAAKRPGYDIS
jgi:hypothetical protein